MNSKQYHTFLSHNNIDKPAVEYLAQRLRQEGLEPWLDKWNLIPGEPWQRAIEEALDTCETCTVFIGPSGIGPWQNEEMRMAIDRRISQTNGRFRVIPVVLPGGQRDQRSRLPAFLVATTWVEFHKTLDDGQSFHRLVCGIRGLEPGAGQVIVEGACPYRGLQTFQAEHTSFFFGREALTEWLIDELRSAPGCGPGSGRENRFLAIVGASGSGKSSLARAGLIPALKRGEFEGSQEWPIVICRPGPEPVESLTIALAAEPALKESVSSVRSFMSDLCDDERTLHLMVRTALHNAPETRRVVILIDQFEEIFTLCQSDLLRRALINNLLYAASVTPGKTIVILTMRADFYGKCASCTNLAAALSDHQVLVGPMTEEELRRAIERPAQLVGCELEPGLTEMLVHDFKNQAGALPLLQHALSELWKRRECRRLTLAAYESIGRLHGALERRANDIYDSFDETKQKICRRLLMSLIQPGEGTEDTKRRAKFQELLPAEGDSEPIDTVIQTLADARLITTEGGTDQPEDRFIEVAHESLIRGWSKLRLWIDSDRESLLVHRRLSDAAAEWDSIGRNDSYLYVGVRLTEAEEWSLMHADVLNPFDRDFLRASIELRDKNKAAELKQKQFRQRAFLITGVLVVVTLLLIFAGLSFFRARRAQQEAEKAREDADVLQLAFASQSQIEGNHELALLLAVEAGRAVEKGEARQSVVEDEVDKALRSVLLYKGDTLKILSFDPNGKDTYKITYAGWSLDGTRIVTVSEDKTASVWNAETGKLLANLSGQTWIWHAAWSFDNTRIVTAGEGTASVWDAQSGRELLKLYPNHVNLDYKYAAVRFAAWNRAGTRIVTISRVITASVWDAGTGRELLIMDHHAAMDRHAAGVKFAAWNRDGTRIVTVNNDKTASVWDAETGRELNCFTGHTAGVNYAAWNNAGTQIVTASQDCTARVWDMKSGDQEVVMVGHTLNVTYAAWSPDDKRIVTASLDGTARVWNAESSEELSRLAGHTAGVIQAAWSPDGKRIVTASNDGTARIWDPESSSRMPVLKGHTATVNYAAWNRKETRIVTASGDNTAIVWDAETGKELVCLKGHTLPVSHTEWSPDDKRIVTASYDGTARLWEAESGKELVCLTAGHSRPLSHAAWSPDDKRIVTTSYDDTARVWDVESGKELVCLTGHSGPVLHAAWSFDNTRIVTASEDATARVWDAQSGRELLKLDHSDHTHAAVIFAIWNKTGTRIVTSCRGSAARVWDAESGKELFTFDGYSDGVRLAAWSPNDEFIVTASNDNTAAIWDARSGKLVLFLRGHGAEVGYAVWSPDGTRIATASQDGTARVWDAVSGQGLASLTGHTDSVQHVAWNAAGTRIVTASADGTARVHYLLRKDMLDAACQRAVRNMTKDEWKRYMGDQPYCETCPD